MMAKIFPVAGPAHSARAGEDLGRTGQKRAAQGLLEELQQQNQELFSTLQELRESQAELAQMHSRELEETNRGVVALYAELDEGAKALQRLSDLKSRFLSEMSHEFRSPLNSIKGLTASCWRGATANLTARAGEAGSVHPQGGRGPLDAGRRPAGPGEGRGGQGRDPARRHSRSRSCSKACMEPMRPMIAHDRVALIV